MHLCWCFEKHMEELSNSQVSVPVDKERLDGVVIQTGTHEHFG